MSLTDEERAFIGEAAAYLEHPNYTARVSGILGRPAEALLKSLPKPAEGAIVKATDKALRKCLGVAITSLLKPPLDGDSRNVKARYAATFSSGFAHSGASYLTGMIGGVVGAPALPVELPLTTTIMLRSIADIARQMGADLREPREQLECLAVFGLGHTEAAMGTLRPGELGEGLVEGRRTVAMEDSGYFATRHALTSSVQAAARFLAEQSPKKVVEVVMKGRSPVVTKLIGLIAGRFQTVVAQKTVLQLLPVIGAVTATTINLAFLDHFNQVARYHFGLRLLEREHGEAEVQRVYLRCLPPPGASD